VKEQVVKVLHVFMPKLASFCVMSMA